eukprot:UN23576
MVLGKCEANNQGAQAVMWDTVCQPDCNACATQFQTDGGCACWTDDECDEEALITDGCAICEDAAAALCGIDIDTDDECVDGPSFLDPQTNTMKTCAEAWAAASAMMDSCPAPLAALCPVTCGTCADSPAEEDSCTWVQQYYSNVCQVIVPSTDMRAYEMCPDLFQEPCDVT